MRLGPDSSPSGPSVDTRPAPPVAPGPDGAVVQEKHLHPALLAMLRRRIAQAAGHPGLPYN